MGKTKKSNRSCKEDDDDLMYYAELLLDLPRLVYMSEFKDARWKSTKKRSPRSRRVDFNCKKAAGWSLMEHFGLGASSDSVSWRSSNKTVGSGLARKKRKNPNPPGSMEIPLPPCKKRLLKVKFKFSGTASPSNQLRTVAEKDSSSGVSNELSVQATCCYVSASETEPQPSSSVVVHNDNNKPNNQNDNEMHTRLIPDLNIPIMTSAPPDPIVPGQPQKTTNNNGYNDHAAAAKEKRKMRMMKLKERKRG